MDQKCRVHCKGCKCTDPCASPELDWRISCRLTCKKRPGRDKSFLSITVVHCYFIHTHLNVVRIKQETIFLPAEVRQWWITTKVTVENSRLTIREMHFIWGVDYFGFVCKRRRRGRLNCFPLQISPKTHIEHWDTLVLPVYPHSYLWSRNDTLPDRPYSMDWSVDCHPAPKYFDGIFPEDLSVEFRPWTMSRTMNQDSSLRNWNAPDHPPSQSY